MFSIFTDPNAYLRGLKKKKKRDKKYEVPRKAGICKINAWIHYWVALCLLVYHTTITKWRQKMLFWAVKTFATIILEVKFLIILKLPIYLKCGLPFLYFCDWFYFTSHKLNEILNISGNFESTKNADHIYICRPHIHLQTTYTFVCAK